MKVKDKKAVIWDKRNKLEGDPYKKYILDPIIIDLIKIIKNKVVLDQGCGNGYFSTKILKKKPKKMILLDLFDSNLEFAKKNLHSFKKTKFIQHDLNKPTDLPSNSVDVIVSNMVLCEIKNFQTVIKDSFRILKKDGIYILSVVHPAFSLKLYLYSVLKNKPEKILPPRHYFDNQKSSFILGKDSHKKSLIEAPHYTRTIGDYFKTLKKYGFIIDDIIEPKISKKLIKMAPRFIRDLNCPLSLVIKAHK